MTFFDVGPVYRAMGALPAHLIRRKSMSEQPDFTAGQVVFLNSGSPPLTVADCTRPGGYVDVEWFDGAEARQASFPRACLSATMNIEHPL